VLNRLGSGSRPPAISPGASSSTFSPYSIPNQSNSNLNLSSDLNHPRTSIDQDPQQIAKYFRSPVDETPNSASVTPVALQPTSGQPRQSMDTLEPLDDSIANSEFPPSTKSNNSPRPLSDPDLKQQLPNRLPVESAEPNLKIPNIMPRKSSIAYSISTLRPNLNVPPQIVPRGSSREYSTTHGLNIPQSNRGGISPVSPSSSPGGHNYPLHNRSQDPLLTTTKDTPVVTPSAKNGPSLNERRNNPSVPPIQTQSLADIHSASHSNRQQQYNEIETGSTHSSLQSSATVVGGTRGFGRRPSHKRNHSSADVIHYQPSTTTAAQAAAQAAAAAEAAAVAAKVISLSNHNFFNTSPKPLGE
jgi:hypothetical protein